MNQSLPMREVAVYPGWPSCFPFSNGVTPDETPIKYTKNVYSWLNTFT